MKILLDWLDLIPIKKILNIKLSEKLSETYNKITRLNYIISFDIEFLRYFINYKDIQTIHEMGGLVFCKQNDEWYLYCLFHLNLIPLFNNIKKYYLLLSMTNTVSEDTYNKLLENEKQLLPEFNPKSILTKIYKSNKIDKIKFMIKAINLEKYKKEYELFKENIYLILNDRLVKKREINKDLQKIFIKFTNILFSNSYLIIKGLEDLKALKNHTLQLQEKYIKITNYYDIAIHNDYLHKICNSAKLENTYFCVEKRNLIKPYFNFLNNLENFTEIKAHNPLIDAYYTWIIFNIFILGEL